jgi:hypothetical protein
MIGPAIARELARQREEAIAREVERPRAPQRARGGKLLPPVTVLVAVLLLLALGAPLP